MNDGGTFLVTIGAITDTAIGVETLRFADGEVILSGEGGGLARRPQPPDVGEFHLLKLRRGTT